MEQPLPSKLLTKTKFVIEYESALDRSPDTAYLFFCATVNNAVLPQFCCSHWRHENEQGLRELEKEVSAAFMGLLPNFLTEAVELAFGIAYERCGGNESYEKRKSDKTDQNFRKEIADRAGRRARKLAKVQQELRTTPGASKKPITEKGLRKAYRVLGSDASQLDVVGFFNVSDTHLRHWGRDRGLKYKDIKRLYSNPK